jgi:DNA-directed RNA polymerase specialized sigma24 family protein
MNFTYNQAINMIWYFSDSDNNGYKSITDNKIKELFKLIDNIDNQDINYYDLIGLYKSELYDTRNIIISRMKNYIDKIIFSLCNEFNIKVDSNIYKEFESEIQYYLLLVINRTSLNNYGQIVRYMDLTVKGYSRKYISNYKETHNDLSLDEPVFSDDKENKATKTRIDYIEAKNTEEDTSFSIDMMNVLSTLSKEDLSFVVLKYQENYNNEELAKHFKISLDEVKEKDIRILSLLRNNDDIKILKKETDNKQ